MTRKEAQKALIEGKCLWHFTYFVDTYCYLDRHGAIQFNDASGMFTPFTDDRECADGWKLLVDMA